MLVFYEELLIIGHLSSGVLFEQTGIFNKLRNFEVVLMENSDTKYLIVQIVLFSAVNYNIYNNPNERKFHWI